MLCFPSKVLVPLSHQTQVLPAFCLFLDYAWLFSHLTAFAQAVPSVLNLLLMALFVVRLLLLIPHISTYMSLSQRGFSD